MNEHDVNITLCLLYDYVMVTLCLRYDYTFYKAKLQLCWTSSINSNSNCKSSEVVYIILCKRWIWPEEGIIITETSSPHIKIKKIKIIITKPKFLFIF